MSCSPHPPPPGFSIHGIFQERMLKWVAISYSGGCSRPRDRAVSYVSCVRLADRFFTISATWEAPQNECGCAIWAVITENEKVACADRRDNCRTLSGVEMLFPLLSLPQTPRTPCVQPSARPRTRPRGFWGSSITPCQPLSEAIVCEGEWGHSRVCRELKCFLMWINSWIK